MQKYNLHIKSYLPSIILVSILLFFASCRDIQEHRLFGRRSLKKALLWAQQDSTRVADSLKRTLIVVDIIDEKLQDSSVISKEEILTEEDTENQYYIIVGTYANPENAKVVARNFRQKGYQTSIIKGTNNFGNSLNMVSVNSFTNYEEAFRYKNKFRIKVDSTAWLYQSK